MTNAQICPQCQAPLPAGASEGLCPTCLLKRGLESNTVGPTVEGGAAARWMPPGLEEVAARFPELEIARLIGRGGMGAVYEGRQKNLDRVVALKILPPEIGGDAAFKERFAREAQAMARLNHPHIVAIHEFGERGGWYYFVMEFVDGVNLRGLLDSGHVSPKEALAIVPQICEALQYAHDQGIVHRDIKPENILLNKQGQVKIADFGLAKLMGGTAASSGATERVMGTPQYMAPEQMERPAEVDHRADIYSLGVVFYQMLTGELPVGRFAAPSKKVRIDVRLDEVVLRALEREPEKRYQQVSEVRTEVETIVTSPIMEASVVPSETAPTSSSARSPRSPLIDSQSMQRARQDIRIPSIGLRIAAVINLLLIASILLFVVLSRAFVVPSPTGEATFVAAPGVLLPALGLMVNLFILISAMRMANLRNYGRAVAASILAMLAFPGNLIGLPFGIWALIVLSRREVKDAFKSPDSGSVGHEQSPTPHVPFDTSSRPRFSRTAIIGICWAFMVLPMIVLINGISGPAFSREDFNHFDTHSRWQWIVVLLGVAAPFGTTILGCVAISQIRHSAGRIYGLGLAFFDSLVFPILLLDGFLVWATCGVTLLIVTEVGAPTFSSGPWPTYPAPGLWAALAITTCFLADALIIRWAWRAAKRPLDGAGAPIPSAPRKVNCVALAFALGSIVVGILGITALIHYWGDHAANGQ